MCLSWSGFIPPTTLKLRGEGILRGQDKYEETIKLDEERLRAKVPQTRSFWTVYEYLKAFPVTSIPIAAKHLNLSYNSISKAFATLQKYNLIMQGSNTTRNRVCNTPVLILYLHYQASIKQHEISFEK